MDGLKWYHIPLLAIGWLAMRIAALWRKLRGRA